MYLVLFDCDGTLVDSQHQIVASVRRAFDFLGLPHPDRDDILATVGLSLPVAFARLLKPWPQIDPEQATLEYRQSAVRAHAAGSLEPLYPGARDALQALQARDDIVLGVVTGKGRRGLTAIIEGHGLNGCFAVTKTADDALSKPHPQMVLDAVAEMAVPPENVVVVGDTTFDMAMAESAGVHRIGVTWGYHAHALLAEHGPVAIIDRFEQLVPEILTLFGIK